MSANNAARLVESAYKRHEDVLGRAQSALEAMVRNGEIVTVSRLANYAKVSRSWIYTQGDLLLQIEQCQQHAGSVVPSCTSQNIGASAESLRRRLELAHQRIAELKIDNKHLQEALARAYGKIREGKLLQ